MKHINYNLETLHTTYYDAMYANEKDASVYAKCCKGKDILELACGTGRILQQLAQSKSLTGIDYSKTMLKKAAGKGLGATLIEADIRQFETGTQFDIILLGLKTIHMFDLDDRLKIYTQVKKHLLPSGIFLLNVVFWNPAQVSSNTSKTWETIDGIVTREQTSIFAKNGVVKCSMTFTLESPCKGRCIEIEDFTGYFPTQEEFIKEIEKVGLTILGEKEISENNFIYELGML